MILPTDHDHTGIPLGLKWLSPQEEALLAIHLRDIHRAWVDSAVRKRHRLSLLHRAHHIVPKEKVPYMGDKTIQSTVKLPCEHCSNKRWMHILPQGDDTLYWIASCPSCLISNFTDDDAAMLASEQLGYPPESGYSELLAQTEYHPWHVYLEGVPLTWIGRWEPFDNTQTFPEGQLL